jgi:hypothetical protein
VITRADSPDPRQILLETERGGVGVAATRQKQQRQSECRRRKNERDPFRSRLAAARGHPVEDGDERTRDGQQNQNS